VVLEGAPGDPALACSPGLVDARLTGLAIQAAPGMPAIEAVGGCHIELDQVTVGGDLVVLGGALGAIRLTHDGRITVSDRGSLTIEDARIGTVAAEHGDLRLRRVSVGGGVSQRGGALVFDGVRVRGDGSGAALQLDHCRATLRDVEVVSAAVGIACTAAELSEIDGLTVRSTQASIAWTGERQPGWTWGGLSLSTPPSGMPAPPAGTGARPDRLPP
jgi:hypothetical protein